MTREITIEEVGDKIIVWTPWSPRAPSELKSLGGRWNGQKKIWVLDLCHIDKVRQILLVEFGKDDIGQKDDEQMCTVEVDVWNLFLNGFELPLFVNGIACLTTPMWRPYEAELSGENTNEPAVCFTNHETFSWASGGIKLVSVKDNKQTGLLETGSVLRITNVPHRNAIEQSVNLRESYKIITDTDKRVDDFSCACEIAKSSGLTVQDCIEILTSGKRLIAPTQRRGRSR